MKEPRVYDREVEPETAPEGIFTREHRENLRSRWLEIQSSFIDEPRRAVDQAEEMLRELLSALSDRLEESRSSHEAGTEPSTESLRRTLQSYRSLFDRMVAL